MKFPHLLTFAAAIVLLLPSLRAATIDTQPVSPGPVTEGTSFSLSVVATKTDPAATGVIYTWRKNGSLVSGATGSSMTVASAKLTDEGSYTVSVRDNVAGSALITSDPVAIVVLAKPKITVQPKAVTADQFTSPTFTVTATGAAPLTYRWQKNGIDIPLATNSSFTIPSLDPSDAGNYRVIVSNPTFVNVASTQVALKVNTIPIITVQPTLPTNPRAIASGGTGILKVVATGLAPLSYKWYRDGVLIPTAKAASYTVTGNATGPGAYRVEITNRLNTGAPTVSETVNVEVDGKPTITTQPSISGPVASGSNVTLSVVAGGSAIGRTYQWQKDGKNILLADNATAQSDTLIMNPITWYQRGIYRVIVTNRVGTITSRTVTVVVNSSPVIITQPVNTTGPLKGSASLSVVAGGNTPLTYKWFRKLNGEAAFSELTTAKASKLTISGLDYLKHQGEYYCEIKNNFPVTGTVLNTNIVTLTVVETPKVQSITWASNNPVNPTVRKIALGGNFSLTVTATPANPTPGHDSKTYQWQRNNVNIPGATTDTFSVVGATLSNAGTYRCLVRNASGVTATSVGTLVSVLTPPTITTPPVNQAAVYDDTVSFKVVAAGSPALKYQWRKDTVLLTGKTAATLTLTLVNDLSVGSYTCDVTNEVGTVTSAGGTLTVDFAPSPLYTKMSPPQARKTEKVRILGDGLSYTKEVFFGTTKATFLIESDATLLVTVPNLVFPQAAPAPIRVVTKGGEFNTDPFTLTDPFLPPNDFPINATIITGVQPTVAGTNVGLTASAGEFPRRTGWFSWVAPATATGTYGAQVTGVSQDSRTFDVMVYIYSGPVGGPYVFQASADDFPGQGFDRAEAVFTVTPGTEYLFMIGGYPWSGTGLQNYTDQGFFSMAVVKPPVTVTDPASDFEAEEGFVMNQSIVGQSDWQGQGDVSAAIVASLNETEDQQLQLGGVTSEEGVVIWRSSTSEVSGSLLVSADVSFDTEAGTSHDQFSWTLYDKQKEPIGALFFNQVDGSILAVLSDGTVVTSSQHFGNTGTYRLDIQISEGSSKWSVKLDGVAIFDDLPLPAGVEFGDISAGWVPGHYGAPAKMLIDGFEVKSE